MRAERASALILLALALSCLPFPKRPVPAQEDADVAEVADPGPELVQDVPTLPDLPGEADAPTWELPDRIEAEEVGDLLPDLTDFGPDDLAFPEPLDEVEPLGEDLAIPGEPVPDLPGETVEVPDVADLPQEVPADGPGLEAGPDLPPDAPCTLCSTDLDCADKVRGLGLCRKAHCDPSLCTCTAVALEDGTGCEDGDACTDGEHCISGECVGAEPRSCDDDNPCTSDSCNQEDGCFHAAATGPCDDGDPCTRGSWWVGLLEREALWQPEASARSG
jgi:hypothetical protein